MANGKIIVKGHPTFNANIGISGATPHTWGMERETIAEVFSDQGFPMIDLSGSRGATAQAGTVLLAVFVRGQ